MVKMIVAAPPIPGEFGPLLRLARALAARGHRITFLTGSVYREQVESAGLHFAPLGGAADYDFQQFVAERATAGLAPGPEQLNFDWIHNFVNPMPEQHAALQRLLEQDPDQYLISNVFFLGAVPVKYGVPGRLPVRWVGVSVVGLAVSSDDSSFFGPVPVEAGHDPKAANRAANAQFNEAFAPTRERLNAVLREMGAAAEVEGFVDFVYTVPDATAVLTVPGFEFHRSDLPRTIELVGAFPAEPARRWDHPYWWPVLDGSRPVVVVTQGTLANDDLSQLVGQALIGLADLDVTVVAALGGADPEALALDVPANARVATYVPFGELLPKADLLITNGGASGIHEALSSGLPVIIAGETEDKPANAARLAYHGLGIDLGTATPTPQAIAEATASLLADAQVKQNVDQLAKVYAEHDPVAEIERLVLS
ncbi:nucleotide disphospho-sugar-binding domain-containing protein [Actinoplanes sp. NPDC051470]|uniref:nucleotide disphospho-sugar-binding domain-containing protein n=1 Tax=Actinoplanes sp. NPDC051470 TaxID=3157224 RepID=UPI00343F9BD4